MRRYLIACFGMALICAFGVWGQGVPGHSFTDFVRANDRFGKKLLAIVHETAPEENLAISPLPVSFAFVPLIGGTVVSGSGEQIRNAFEWQRVGGLALSGRLQLVAFEERPLSLKTTFLHRGSGTIAERFISEGKKYFGIDFQRVDLNAHDGRIPHQSLEGGRSLQQTIPGESDFSIVSETKLRTVWAGNTFSLGTRKKRSFTLYSGQTEEAQTNLSESFVYEHGQTESFEVVKLVCLDAYILIVLPTPEKRTGDIEKLLAQGNVSFESVLKNEIGDVELPEFMIRSESDFRPALERMGVHAVFHETDSLSSMVPRFGGTLQRVTQSVEIEVNRQGIRANAETVTNGVYGGICGNCVTPFHMVVNRPFLFFVHDNVTNALLFAGAVMDPNKH